MDARVKPAHDELGMAAALAQCPAALFAAALLSTINPSTATPSLLLIKNGLTSIDAIRFPASAIKLDRPTSAFTAEASCNAGLPRYPLIFTPALVLWINCLASSASSGAPANATSFI